MLESLLSFFRKDSPLWEDHRNRRILRQCLLFMLFLVLTLGGFFALRQFFPLSDSATAWQKGVFTVGGALLLAGVGTLTVAGFGAYPRTEERPVWYCPLMAAGLSLSLYLLGYTFVGIWPLGTESVMMVDMHHQYAPLMSELRDMLLHGGDYTYSFHVGMGVGFIPTFAYYLASPLNLLLVLFPERLLTEAILVITLLKMAGAAAGFTAMAQYLYKERKGTMILVGVLYSMTGYMIAYSWNIMWLDVIALLPLVVMAMEHMLRGGKIAPYACLLALALFANYYIGFMMCVFLVLYALVWLLREKHTGRDVWLGGLRFAAGSLWGGGMAAALLVPTALALGRTSAAGEELGEFATNFPLFDLFGRFFYGAEPTVRSGNLPNLYCGVIAFILLPIYLSQKNIPLRRRISFGGLLALLMVSCTLTQWDLLWHGLHSPNDLPYRFSFLVGFVMLMMAAHVLSHLDKITPKQILGSLAASAAYLILWEKLGEIFRQVDGDAAGKVTTTDKLIYANLLLLALYGVALLIAAARRTPRVVATRLVVFAVCLEMLFSISSSFVALNSSEYYTDHEDYVYHIKHEAIDDALRLAEKLAEEDAENFGSFVRMEYLPRTSCVDTSLHHYSGLTTFASSNPYETIRFMGELGYAINGVNSYLFHGFVAAADSLFALRYVVLEKNITTHAQLKQVGSVSVPDPKTGEDYHLYVYRNELALPLGFMTSSTIKDYTGSKYAPFTSQQNLYESMTGLTAEIYEPLSFTALTDGATIRGSSFHLPGSEETVYFSGDVTEQGQHFAFVDCRAADSIVVTVYEPALDDDGNTLYDDDGNVIETVKRSWGVTNHEPYVIDMGTLKPGMRVEVTLDSERSASGNLYVQRLLPDALKQHLSVLNQGGMMVTEQKGDRIKGAVTAKKNGVLFLSIPYDKGWKVTVDGQEVQTFPISDNAETEYDDEGNEITVGGDDGALLGVELAAGSHEVELSFRAPGQTIGLLISIGSLLILLVPIALRFMRRKKASAPASKE